MAIIVDSNYGQLAHSQPHRALSCSRRGLSIRVVCADSFFFFSFFVMGPMFVPNYGFCVTRNEQCFCEKMNSWPQSFDHIQRMDGARLGVWMRLEAVKQSDHEVFLFFKLFDKVLTVKDVHNVRNQFHRRVSQVSIRI